MLHSDKLDQSSRERDGGAPLDGAAGQGGLGIPTGIRELIGWPKLPAATDQYVLPLLSLPGPM